MKPRRMVDGRKRNTVAFLLVVLAAVLIGCTTALAESPDQEVLDQLRDAGSNMDRVHMFTFYLYHQDSRNGRRMCERLASEGFTAHFQERPGSELWLCLAQTVFLPQIELLLEVQGYLEQIALEYGGIYDGWETQVER